MRLAVLPLLVAAIAHSQTIPIVINTARVIHRLDLKIYGQSVPEDLSKSHLAPHPPLLRWNVPADWKLAPASLAKFLASARTLNAEPLLVLHQITDAAELVAWCNTRPESHPVKYWELDSGAQLLTVRAMKKVDPAIQIIAPLAGKLADPAYREIFPLLDLLSLHALEEPAKFAESPSAAERLWQRTGPEIAASPNPKLKLVLADWSAGTADWRTALYGATLLHAMHADPRLAMAAAADNPLHQLVLQLFRDHFATDQLAIAGATSPVSALAMRDPGGDRIYLQLVNPTARELTIEVSLRGDFPILSAAIQLLAPDRLNALTARIADAPIERAPAGLRLHLPRWSVAALTLAR